MLIELLRDLIECFREFSFEEIHFQFTISSEVGYQLNL